MVCINTLVVLFAVVYWYCVALHCYLVQVKHKPEMSLETRRRYSTPIKREVTVPIASEE